MPIEQVVSNLISECCELNISDLHIKVYDLEADIHIRKDGDMQLLRQIGDIECHGEFRVNALKQADSDRIGNGVIQLAFDDIFH